MPCIIDRAREEAEATAQAARERGATIGLVLMATAALMGAAFVVLLLSELTWAGRTPVVYVVAAVGLMVRRA